MLTGWLTGWASPELDWPLDLTGQSVSNEELVLVVLPLLQSAFKTVHVEVAEIVSSLGLFHQQIVLSLKTCCLRSIFNLGFLSF